MLSYNKIIKIANIFDIKLKIYNDIPISVYEVDDIDIKYDYILFKEEMELENLYLHWLLGKNNMIAGGAVLNWILGENKNNDIDFFFKNNGSIESFSEFIKNIGFKETSVSGYATTYFEKEQSVILQIVGSPNENFLGTPQQILKGFDLHICKFAVDNNYIYTTKNAVCDLLQLSLITTGNENNILIDRRMQKYIRRGFYPLENEIKYVKQTARKNSLFF